MLNSSPFQVEKATHLLQGKGGNVPACLSKMEAQYFSSKNHLWCQNKHVT